MKKPRHLGAHLPACLLGVIKQYLTPRELGCCLRVRTSWNNPVHISKLTLDLSLVPYSSLEKLFNLVHVRALRIIDFGASPHVNGTLMLFPNLEILFVPHWLYSYELFENLRFLCATAPFPGRPHTLPRKLQAANFGRYYFRDVLFKPFPHVPSVVSRLTDFRGFYDYHKLILEEGILEPAAKQSIKWDVPLYGEWPDLCPHTIHAARLHAEEVNLPSDVFERLCALPNLQLLHISTKLSRFPQLAGWNTLQEVHFQVRVTPDLLRMFADVQCLDRLVFLGCTWSGESFPCLAQVKTIKIQENERQAWRVICEGQVFPCLRNLLLERFHVACSDLVAIHRTSTGKFCLENLFLNRKMDIHMVDLKRLDGLAKKICIDTVVSEPDKLVRLGNKSQWVLPRLNFRSEEPNVALLDRTEMFSLFEKAGMGHFNAAQHFDEVCEEYKNQEQ